MLSLLRKNPTTIQEDILNLLGFDEFEFIEKVLSAREIILKSVNKSANNNKNVNVKTPGSSITLKKSNEKLGKYFASEWDIQEAEEEKTIGNIISKSVLQSQQVQHFPHVYGGKKELNFGSKLSLPIGTDHKNMHSYEEFVITFIH